MVSDYGLPDVLVSIALYKVYKATIAQNDKVLQGAIEIKVA